MILYTCMLRNISHYFNMAAKHGNTRIAFAINFMYKKHNTVPNGVAQRSHNSQRNVAWDINGGAVSSAAEWWSMLKEDWPQAFIESKATHILGEMVRLPCDYPAAASGCLLGRCTIGLCPPEGHHGIRPNGLPDPEESVIILIQSQRTRIYHAVNMIIKMPSKLSTSHRPL